MNGKKNNSDRNSIDDRFGKNIKNSQISRNDKNSRNVSMIYKLGIVNMIGIVAFGHQGSLLYTLLSSPCCTTSDQECAEFRVRRQSAQSGVLSSSCSLGC